MSDIPLLSLSSFLQPATNLRHRFKVQDCPNTSRDELIAWSCIRLDRLQSGYRWVDLLDPTTRAPFVGKLFVKIEKVLRD